MQNKWRKSSPWDVGNVRSTLKWWYSWGKTTLDWPEVLPGTDPGHGPWWMITGKDHSFWTGLRIHCILEPAATLHFRWRDAKGGGGEGRHLIKRCNLPKRCFVCRVQRLWQRVTGVDLFALRSKFQRLHSPVFCSTFRHPVDRNESGARHKLSFEVITF